MLLNNIKLLFVILILSISCNVFAESATINTEKSHLLIGKLLNLSGNKKDIANKLEDQKKWEKLFSEYSAIVDS